MKKPEKTKEQIYEKKLRELKKMGELVGKFRPKTTPSRTRKYVWTLSK